MSSHREAPEISKDPVADNTDTYAFVSPDKPGTVTLIANYLPLQLPNGGPNFYEFSDDVLYEIHVSNAGTGMSDISYQFRFTTHVRTPGSFLYITGPVANITDTTFNRYQTFTMTKVVTATGASKVVFQDKIVPPVNVGVRSTPNYAALAAQGIYSTTGQFPTRVFCGQRAEAFHVDLGSIFDLGDLRPFQGAYNSGIPPMLGNMPGVNGTQGLNVHTIAIQVPMRDVSSTGTTPTDATLASSVIGVYATASRQTGSSFNTSTGTFVPTGPWQQVSRLGMPLVNEVLTPMGSKDYWNSQPTSKESQFVANYQHPELANLIANVLYPTAFPNLASYTKVRSDVVAIFLTGLPPGVVAGFQNYTGSTQADMVRLNMAVPATKPGSENVIGLLAGDAAGFPNGRRIIDDVVAIELKALAGLTIPLVDGSYTPDAAASAVNDGTSYSGPALKSTFPYLGDPLGGYSFQPGTGTV